MQYKKQAINQKILESGKEEFLEKGYRNGNIINIAKRAGIPVSSLYRYFESKRALLDAIVAPAYIQLPQTIAFLSQIDETAQNFSLEEVIPSFSENLMTLFDAYGKEIILLVDKCESTQYEDFFDKIVSFVEKIVYDKFFGEGSEQDYLFASIVSKSFVSSMIEVMRQNKPREEMKAMFNRVLLFYFSDVMTRVRFGGDA